MTRVSVVIPAFRAHDSLPRALRSIAASGWPGDQVEIVIAPDDGDSYAAFAQGWGRRRILPPGPVASGPGHTRNRALAASTGAIVAFLDADDTWAPGYLAGTVPLAETHGLAFAPTEVFDADKPLLRLPKNPRLTFRDLAQGASFHPVLRRDWAGPFAARPSQDVFHAVEALALAGGSAPLGAAPYQLHLNQGSITRADDYSARVAAAYSAYAAEIRAGTTRVPQPLRGPAAQVFDSRIALNAAFAAQDTHSRFYDFLATTL